MNEEQVREAYAKYGYKNVRLLGQSKGYRNTSYIAAAQHAALNLILYKDEPRIGARIKRTNRLGNFVSSKGIPARSTADSRILRIDSSSHTRYAALYHYLPGETIAWEAYTQKHLKLLGNTLAKLHTATQSFDASEFPHVCDEYQDICERMDSYFNDSLAMRAAAQKLQIAINHASLNLFRNVLQACKNLPEQQILHMDFVRSNILFATGSKGSLKIDDVVLSGVLDFEKAAYGHRIFDIARTHAFLLVDSKHKPPEKVLKYFILSGYIKRGEQTVPRVFVTLDDVRTDVFETLISLFLLYDLYKFMRHNPYEYLAQNEHYTRTRDLLIARKVVVKS